MKITISQKELNKAINIVQKAVTTRTALPILSGILIEASDNRLNFTATDLELGINTYVECDVIEEGSIVVHSKLLGDFVRKLPSNSLININTTKTNNMELKCLNSDFNILGNSSKEFPYKTFENDGTRFSINSDVLKSLIKYTSFAVSQDNMKPIFTGCLLEVKDGICSFVALDGFRMAVKSENINLDEEIQTVIPSKALNEVIRILEEDVCDVGIILSESHISFNIDNTTIISSLLEGKFVDYKSLLKNDFVTTIKIGTSEFKNSIERASLLGREDKNSKYIIDVLRVIDSEEVEMKFLGNINPCFINEADNSNFKYMVLPVRIS